MGHCEINDADRCFGCKLRYWRDGEGVPLRFTRGRRYFSEATNAERIRQDHADAAKAGAKLTPVGTRWV